MTIHRGATREQQIAAEAARSEGRAEGYLAGFVDGVLAAADQVEREGDAEAARRLREASVVPGEPAE